MRTGIGLLTLTIPLWGLQVLLTQYGGLLGLQIFNSIAMGPSSLVLDSLQVFLMVLLATACLVLTTLEPERAPLERDDLLRKRLRIIAVAYVVFGLASRVIWSLIGLKFGLVPVVSVITHVILLLSAAYCLFAYLAALIDRTPTRRGAGLIRVLRYIYLPIMAIGEISELFLAWGWFMKPPPSGRMLPTPWWGTSTFLLGGAAGLIATIIFVTLLARFYFDLDRICKQVSAEWSERGSQGNSSGGMGTGRDSCASSNT
ncbi:MAG: hypothetical protein H6819_10280 [Phycisphaerales bacterium]|nr:hypothetical protein [Phycisphaerales bacterium]